MLEKILDLVTKNGFIKQNIQKLNIEYLKVGPTGLILLNNLKTEWFHNIVINKDVTVFLNSGNVDETFEFAKNLCLEKLPFGIAECYKDKKVSSDIVEYYKQQMNKKEIDFESLFMPEENQLLKCTIFVSPNNSTQFFHQWQRERRMWWRKVRKNKIMNFYF